MKVGDFNELVFQEKVGKNITLFNNRKTATRMNANSQGGNAGLYTSRPVFDEELFQVAVEVTVDEWKGLCLGIGITVLPNFEDSPYWMTDLNSVYWIMYWNSFNQRYQIYNYGRTLLYDYGQHYSKPKIGDLFGFVKKSNGDLHFFINGKDQGKAASSISDCAWGIVDVSCSVVQGRHKIKYCDAVIDLIRRQLGALRDIVPNISYFT